MKLKPMVQILMATYNGEKYIRKQIDSLIGQTYKNWKLFIRDDGSSDSTVDIIREYAKTDRRISFIVNSSEVHSWQTNFQELIFCADKNADYFMFCDQDDIWFDDKIEYYIKAMKKTEGQNPDKPVVIYADMDIIDGNDVKTCDSLNRVYPMRLSHITDSFFAHRLYGCNEMFNKKVLELIILVLDNLYVERMAHDGLVVKITAADGGIVRYLPKTTMHYRRDGNNATVNQQLEVNIHKIISKLKNYNRSVLDQVSAYRQALWTIDLVKNSKYDFSCRNQLLEIEKALKKGGLPLLKVWIKYKVNCGSKLQTLSHFFVLLTGSHKKHIQNPAIRTKRN